MTELAEVLIVGGGNAALSAASILGRAGRRVLLIQPALPADAASSAPEFDIRFSPVGGSGPEPPLTLPTVERRNGQVTAVGKTEDGYKFQLDDGAIVSGKKVLLATESASSLPDVAGIYEFLGRGVHCCPHSDGWQYRGLTLAALGNGVKAYALALELTFWTEKVVLFSGGRSRLSMGARERLRGQRIQLYQEPVARLCGDESGFTAVELQSGLSIPCSALFVLPGLSPSNSLAQQLGCSLKSDGTIYSDSRGATTVPGVYVAGEVDLVASTQLPVVAAAEGAKAALGILAELLGEKVGLSTLRPRRR